MRRFTAGVFFLAALLGGVLGGVFLVATLRGTGDTAPGVFGGFAAGLLFLAAFCALAGYLVLRSRKP